MRRREKEIKNRFLNNYKNAKSELIFNNDYELLVCVMLSAQCLDSRVNLITPSLFANYPDINSLANANLMNIKELIKSCNFYQNKAINLIKMAKSVVEFHSGIIPMKFDDLINLAGVGEKTANVVLCESLGANVMAVDTHIFRVSKRLKISNAKTPNDCAKELTKLFKTDLDKLHKGMVLFGRYICKAKKPDCNNCFLNDLCDEYKEQKNSNNQ
ncbi:endonuclease III [Campylobacter sp. RM12640]|uniref:endonuclease III n=1 Tax=unclassified Campylobacter TaxID=2593542 RepID=UPI001BD991DD|nr:endonuclease III [Campylobacter sp. 2018MI01]MBT0878726.1 endonuclease III [Campylobacter sp. 2018MI01]MBZ7981672.1 endonuclease III [Campylobacter sp. RM12640]MBZ7988551.1 endonuclease III [Campylobacter sp. RM12635]